MFARLTVALEVIESEHDDRPGAGKDFTGIDTAFGPALHPGHVAVATVADPLHELARMRSLVASRDAAILEPEPGRKRDDLSFQCREIRIGRVHGWSAEK